MKKPFLSPLFLLVGIFLYINNPLFGWWDAGHMAVAQIAYEQLQPEVKEKIDNYLEITSTSFPKHSDFITASVWADDIVEEGIETFRSWHSSAYPYDPENILSPQEHEKILSSLKNQDVVWALNESIKTLKNPKASPWAKGFMLRVLIHMIGDIHQPLHCTTYFSKEFPEGDRAGTRFKIKHEKYKSLHQLFDAACGLGDFRPERPLNEEDRQRLTELVSSLLDQFPREAFVQLEEKNIDHWRQESYDLGKNFVYANISPNEAPTEDFIEEGKEVTGKQLTLAGYRLADLLNVIIK